MRGLSEKKDFFVFFGAFIGGVIIIASIQISRSLTPTTQVLADTTDAMHRSMYAMDMPSTKTNAATPTDPPDAKPTIPMDPIGPADLNNMDPMVYLTTWNFSNLAPAERSKFYQAKPLPNGTMQREYWLYGQDKTITIAKGITYDAWTYNGQLPGPTLRATQGDTIIVHFTNQTTHPHTIHFHNYHPGDMDGALEDQYVKPGKTVTYTIPAAPFGVHLYHCHTNPIEEHIGRGMYGMLIIDPKYDTRPKPAKELIMMMNGFDLKNKGEDNDIYAVNQAAFYYYNHPIQVKTHELVRIYLANITELDPINSFHLHGNFFSQYSTGTRLTPDNFTDTIIMGQGERSILDVQFQYPGKWMFHSHKNEFADLGWMGIFEAQ